MKGKTIMAKTAKQQETRTEGLENPPFNVWIKPVSREFGEKLSSLDDAQWSVPRQAHQGDLLLYYHTAPDSCIKDIFILDGPLQHVNAEWKGGLDFMGPIRRVCRLRLPLFFKDMKGHPLLHDEGFVKEQPQGGARVTHVWQCLYDLLVDINPSVRKKLAKKFHPARL